MAWYPKAVVKNIPPGANDPRITPRVLIYHVSAGESSSLYPYFNGPSGGVESHFYVTYAGVVEQYRDTAYQADANMRANDFAISIETEGLADGTWNAAQIAALKALSDWICRTHNIPRTQCTAWNGSGIGWHNLFSTEWAGGPRACPGPNRIQQVKSVLLPYLAHPTEEDMPLNANDIKAIHDSVVGILRAPEFALGVGPRTTLGRQIAEAALARFLPRLGNTLRNGGGNATNQPKVPDPGNPKNILDFTPYVDGKGIDGVVGDVAAKVDALTKQVTDLATKVDALKQQPPKV